MLFIFSQMGDHDKALRMLALRLSDLEAAERHCDEMSRGKEQQFKKKLLLNLLKICLNPDEGCDAAALSNAARDLFNRRSREFDAVSALSLLPDSWSLASVQEGLEKAVQESADKVIMFHFPIEVREQNIKLLSSRVGQRWSWLDCPRQTM